ncbi:MULTISPECIES: SH3 domain-containing protein [Halorhodospira]|uniref:SH3 domain-containing protein n=1 Tax=Halorhodospira TaxID=85108 RepID=UPI001EE9A127|nr:MULTISPECIES: SH3 domain-containing protein [Halorhodospira]MCG5526833.1 SH3 domain-containing protein [Halorhodospira halophila]MCG5542830.1 SH3 domain-containing protein [Halorhodospira sp. 9628]
MVVGLFALAFFSSLFDDGHERETLYSHGTVNIRSEPTTDSEVVAQLSEGDQIEVQYDDAQEGWARLVGHESEGYVFTEVLHDTRPEGCHDNWTKCKDNKDLINNYAGITDAQISCERAASELAKYGDPDFPFISFGRFRQGDNYIEEGVIELIENEAKMSNAFGSMLRVRIHCYYDLETEQVVDIDIIQ